MIAFPAFKADRKPSPIFESFKGRLRLKSSQFGDVTQVPELTIQNENCGFLDLSQKWGDNYGHWLIDILPGALFDADVSNTVLLSRESFNNFHPREYLELFGFKKHEVIGQWCFGSVVSNPLAYTSLVHPEVIRRIRMLISQAIECYPIGPINIFVQRAAQGCGKLQSRNLENREGILRSFARNGIHLTMVYLEGIPVLQQIAMFAQASIVIGVHGSAMVNVAYCNQKCQVVEISAPHHYNSTYAEIAAHIGFRFSTLIGTLINNRSPSLDCYNYSLSVDPEHLLELLK